MEQRDVERNIRLYFWHVAFGEPLFWGPILVSSLMHLGKMTLSEVHFMEGVVVACILLLEIPSGALADKIGRRKTVLIGTALYVIDSIWFACMNDPVDVWGANLVWVVGYALCSGANRALMYDTLLAGNRVHEYKKIEGKAIGARLLFTAVACLVTSLLATIDLRLPLILSVPGMCVSMYMVYRMKEPTRTYALQSGFSVMKLSILFVANDKSVKWVVFFSALIGVSSKIWFFTYNPYFELVALPIYLYGILFFALNLVAWFFSTYAHFIDTRIGEAKSFLLILLSVALPILCMGYFVATFSVLFVLFQNIARGMSVPFFSDFTNRRIDSEKRATVLSVQSAFSGLSQAIGLIVFSILLAQYSLRTCLLILGTVVLVLGIVGMQKYKKLE